MTQQHIMSAIWVLTHFLPAPAVKL